jgi:Family of unknown function (DUF5759)
MQEGIYTPQLNVTDLYTKRQARDSARLRAYNKILDIIHHRIRTIAELPGAPCTLLYTIPPFILGLPRIDLEDCVVYIVYQLRMAGFDTRYTYPNLLNIGWAHHEKTYILDKSPIMHAMLESDDKKRADEERKAIFAKKLMSRSAVKPKSGGIASGVKKVDFRNEIVIGMRDTSAPSVGHIPSAGQYIPPVSFMKQMTEPPKTTVGGPSVNSAPASAFADLWRT